MKLHNILVGWCVGVYIFYSLLIIYFFSFYLSCDKKNPIRFRNNFFHICKILSKSKYCATSINITFCLCSFASDDWFVLFFYCIFIDNSAANSYKNAKLNLDLDTKWRFCFDFDSVFFFLILHSFQKIYLSLYNM